MVPLDRKHFPPGSGFPSNFHSPIDHCSVYTTLALERTRQASLANIFLIISPSTNFTLYFVDLHALNFIFYNEHVLWKVVLGNRLYKAPAGAVNGVDKTSGWTVNGVNKTSGGWYAVVNGPTKRRGDGERRRQDVGKTQMHQKFLVKGVNGIGRMVKGVDKTLGGWYTVVGGGEVGKTR
jgi:hypothetical protein